jgi:hypothetical protein
VWRHALVALLLAVGLYVAIDALIETDAERVEAEVERLVEVARKGGDEAIAGILDAIADDYRGSGLYERERVVGYVRHYLAEPPEELTTGKVVALDKGDEILIPLLTIHARTRRLGGSKPLRVTFAERDGRFKLVNVEDFSPGR